MPLLYYRADGALRAFGGQVMTENSHDQVVRSSHRVKNLNLTMYDIRLELSVRSAAVRVRLYVRSKRVDFTWSTRT